MSAFSSNKQNRTLDIDNECIVLNFFDKDIISTPYKHS
jgi:hypothetical protein